MATEDDLKSAKATVILVGEMIKAAGDNPNVRAAGVELGQTALTLTKTINNALLPLAAVNFAFEKAREYFAERFQKDLSEKASKIPHGQIIEPKASIAGPALQGLAFSHEEPDLKNMYLGLLASAMDRRVADRAHPAFVEFIRQMTVEEAQMLRTGLTESGGIPIVEVRLSSGDGDRGWTTQLRHLLNLMNSNTNQPTENPRLPAMVDNWIRLGIYEVDYMKFLTGSESYAWVEKRPEFLHLKAIKENEKQKLSFERGIMQRTALGQQFATAVGIISSEEEKN